MKPMKTPAERSNPVSESTPDIGPEQPPPLASRALCADGGEAAAGADRRAVATDPRGCRSLVETLSRRVSERNEGLWPGTVERGGKREAAERWGERPPLAPTWGRPGRLAYVGS